MLEPMVPAWRCADFFGELCADRGLGVLSSADVELARSSGLRIFVYRNVPPHFHRDLFTAGKPEEVARGRVCDFMRSPCTPPDPPPSEPGYSKGLNEWLTGAKHAADVPLLAKLLALGSLSGVHTDDPAMAHLFVVPFLGGFVERVSPAMSQALDREQRQSRGIVDKLFDHLPHMSNATSARHLFLLTNSCGGCLRGACYRCASWQLTRPERRLGVELAATLGPSWPEDQTPKRSPSGRKWVRQLIIPPNVMEAELHHPQYVPLCSDSASRKPCRPNTANKELFAFYQGAHSFNGVRDLILAEMHRVVFGQASRTAATACDCRAKPSCCVNASSRVAFFHSRSHWHPVTPLGFGATIEWMQRSRFCICPPGDVPYNKRCASGRRCQLHSRDLRPLHAWCSSNLMLIARCRRGRVRRLHGAARRLRAGALLVPITGQGRAQLVEATQRTGPARHRPLLRPDQPHGARRRGAR